MVKTRPIIFSAGMVRAILDGQKTQTRRIVKRQGDMEFDTHDPYYGPYWLAYAAGDADGEDTKVRCPYGNPGDRLWVRETWGIFCDLGFSDTSWAGIPGLPDGWSLAYRADHVDPVNGDGPHSPYWRPSIFMPRWASRITLEITGVRVERLKEISEDDARAEGCFPVVHEDGAVDCGTRKTTFRNLWQSIHGPGSWDSDSFVWVIEFKRLRREGEW